MSNLNVPFISLILPVRNEEKYIQRTLEVVFSQDYPQDKIEIIVADGMSTDGTRDIIKSYQVKYANLRLIDNLKKIAAWGLNAAIHEAKGDIIIRVDGHCEIASDYVSQCVRLLEEKQADAVGGPIETIGETFTAKVIAVAMSSWFGVGGSAFRTIKNREIEAETVPFPAYRRTVFDKVGFFNEEFVRNQDDEFNFRLLKSGGKILLSPKIKSKYYSRSSLKSLWSQYFQYGYWKVRVMQKHPGQMKPRHFAPALFCLSLMILELLSFWCPFAHLISFMISGLYLTINLLVSLAVSLKNGIGYFFILPFVFLILHLSYGLGFLAGIIKFRNDWRKG